MIAHSPLHRSGRAAFRHAAPASGDYAKTAQRVGMTDACGRQPPVNEPLHPVSQGPAILAAARPAAMPEMADLEPKLRGAVRGHTVISDVPTHDQVQPSALLWNGIAHASSELGVVRRLPRYFWPVRLPVVVQRRRASLDVRTRPMAPCAVGSHRICRFANMVFRYVLRVSDSAEPSGVSRYRRCQFRLPRPFTASAFRSDLLSGLNTRPARTPVYASAPSSRPVAHDSEPAWVASPSPCDSFIHNTLPVLTGTLGAMP